MAYQRKNFAPGELSAIRSAASRARKHMRGGRPPISLPVGGTHQVRMSAWSWGVFSHRAKVRGCSVREILDRTAVRIAQANGIRIPDELAPLA